ncbi:Hsp70 family protein [Nocardia macrotermitis]|uniref:Chaperone protein DnaK n=1 Tax=Nocardia macrotermitis TaxID=2585198 RepID=A0A7K0DE42_9NOCA|nr:Hsp70 family protein [Nocardia macrotermitis]MQY23899.1 Chaperone protein DnaK [Nocardia macrotermitis]
MTRETIDFGIDLGTTNSAIAVVDGSGARVIRNNDQSDFTPSAVYVNRMKSKFVGMRAKERVESDPDNACAEFKLQMGMRGTHKHFAAADINMSPEELSAEVLKSLREDVRSSEEENIGAAVITVPAAFELDQCDATRNAAAAAGLEFAPLIQEPSAAAWAYSAGKSVERGFWLVYDFGGGTFDAAVIRVADGEFSTINHAGDNFLGGKLIDWAIVEQLLIPEARKEPGFTELARGNARYAKAIAKLKAAAENAKIELSRTERTSGEIELPGPGKSDVDFAYSITRAELERLAMPRYRQSIELCRKALAESKLGPGDIDRVLLVGGATLAPGLRKLLADPDEGLGIALDHSLDPVTVVARGAAMFASTQRLPARARPTESGRVIIEMSHEPVGSDPDPLIGGRIRAAQDRDWTGATVEFVNPDGEPPWRSGKVPLTANGAFTTRVHAEAETTNRYLVEIHDAQGNPVDCEPGRISYRHASLVGTPPTLSHSVGIGLDDNEVLWLVRKGSELEAKTREVLRSTVAVRRNSNSGLIRVPFVSGERSKADLNTLIGALDIVPSAVARDVPAGSEVEVELRIDTSFQVHANAYVPILDEEFPITVDLGRNTSTDADELRGAAQDLDTRAQDLSDRARQLGSAGASVSTMITAFARDGAVEQVRNRAEAAAVDPDAARECENRLHDAQAALADIEAALVLPELAAEATDMLESVREPIQRWGNATRRATLRDAERAIENAITAGDETVLRRQIDVVREIFREVLRDSGRLEAVVFAGREEALSGSPDPAIQRLLRKGRIALESGDNIELQQVLMQLDKLAPDDFDVDRTPGGFGSTVGRRW